MLLITNKLTTSVVGLFLYFIFNLKRVDIPSTPYIYINTFFDQLNYAMPASIESNITLYVPLF